MNMYKSLSLSLAALLACSLPWPRSYAASNQFFYTDLSKQHEFAVYSSKALALTAFFDKYKCPGLNYGLIHHYITAAEQSNLDYRLLPSISVIESSCAKRYPVATNNIWGWNSANFRFDSFQQGIAYISQRISTGRHYKGKSVTNKLRAYCPHPTYAARVRGLMAQIK